MGRITDAELRKIITPQMPDTSVILAVANRLVTRILGTQNLTDDELKDIELYVAAHFIAVSEPQKGREKIGDAEVNYTLPINALNTGDFIGFNGTTYGRTVLILDPTGLMSNVGKRLASISAMGIEVTEITE